MTTFAPLLPSKRDSAWLDFQRYLREELTTALGVPPALLDVAPVGDAVSLSMLVDYRRRALEYTRRFEQHVTAAIQREARFQTAGFAVYRVLVREASGWAWLDLPEVLPAAIDAQLALLHGRSQHLLIARFLIQPAEPDWRERLCLEMDSRLLWLAQGRLAALGRRRRLMTVACWQDRHQAKKRAASRVFGWYQPDWIRELREELAA